MVRKLALRKEKRALRVRKSVKGSGLPRATVFRSASHIYGQIIDDVAGKTLVSCSSLELKTLKGDKSEVAKAVGLELAKRAVSKGVDRVAFDRGSFLYHGRVKALADGMREGGLSL
ncbi:MAG TPA: 50S ribosomal protein L18 [Candidatus Babeliales bacterium]|nr:50S ribosomal protein L18 [Candidatus Babeliales bacterium]